MVESGRKELREWQQRLRENNPALTRASESKPSMKAWNPDSADRYALHMFEAHYGLYGQYRVRSKLRKASLFLYPQNEKLTSLKVGHAHMPAPYRLGI